MPTATGSIAGQVADHRVEPEPGVAHVDVPVAPLRRAVGAAHVLREDAPGLDAARDVDAHVALQRRADVVRAHRGRDADRRALVAAAGVERAGDLALLVEDVAALLDPARDQHVAVDAEEVLAVEAGLLHFLQRPDRLGFPDCHAFDLPFGRWVGCTLTTAAARHTDRTRPWRGRDATGSRRSGARRSATGSRSAPPAVTSRATSRSTRRGAGRLPAVRDGARRAAARPAARACRRPSRSSARSAARELRPNELFGSPSGAAQARHVAREVPAEPCAPPCRVPAARTSSRRSGRSGSR